jgi:hypothetical protein
MKRFAVVVAIGGLLVVGCSESKTEAQQAYGECMAEFTPAQEKDGGKLLCKLLAETVAIEERHER